MTQLVMAIEENGCEELNAIAAEAKHAREGNGEALKDVTSQKEIFEDQLWNCK